MLRFFAKLERSRNVLLMVFCGLLLVGLIAFYIPTEYLGPGVGPVRSSEDKMVIAKVGSQEITLKEYKTVLTGLLSNFSQAAIPYHFPLPGASATTSRRSIS